MSKWLRLGLAMALALIIGCFTFTALAEGPEGLSLVRSGKNNVLSWPAEAGADSYKVYAAGKPTGAYKLLGTTTEMTFTHKNAPAAYFYKLRAVTNKVAGPLSEPVGSVAAPVMAGALADGQITFSWQAVPHATGYTLERSATQAGPWTAVQEGITQTRCSVQLQSSEPVFFRLLSLFGSTPSGTSAVKSVYGPVSGVMVICEESYSQGPTNRLNVTWDECTGATSYEVYRASLPSDDYTLLGTTTNNYYADTRKATVAYSYKVRPMYAAGGGAQSAPVTLYSGMSPNVLPDESLSSKSGIILLVNKKAQVVTAYTQDAQGKYTIPLRHMICSTGRVYERTPVGEYNMTSKHDEWYRYPSGVYIRYPSIYRSGLFFHSVLYSSGKSVNTSTVARLGTRQSLGCIRLKVLDAQWVYNNCVNGTLVSIVDGKSISSLTKALKPKTVKVK